MALPGPDEMCMEVEQSVFFRSPHSAAKSNFIRAARAHQKSGLPQRVGKSDVAVN